MLEYNASVTAADCNDPRGLEHVQQRIALLLDLLGGSIEHGLTAIETLIDAVGGVLRLSDVGAATGESLRLLTTQVNPERLSNNPRRMDAAAIEKLLSSITDRNVDPPAGLMQHFDHPSCTAPLKGLRKKPFELPEALSS